MKLSSQDPLSARDRGEGASVNCLGQGEFLRRPSWREAMDEVHIGSLETRDQGMILKNFQTIPTNVGQGHGIGQTFHFPRKKAQTISPAELHAFVEEQLVPDADSEQPRSLFDSGS